MIRRILVGVAGTPTTDAKIAYTVELAVRHRASVSAMSMVDVNRQSKGGPVPLAGAGASAENHRAVDDAAEYVRACGAEVTTAVLEGIPAEAERVGADLLVLGTHYRKAILGKRFGATILGTLKASERPVFMTH